MAKADKTAAAAPEVPVLPQAHDEVAGAEALGAILAPVMAVEEAAKAAETAGNEVVGTVKDGALAALAAAEKNPAHAQEHAAAVNLGQRLAELKHAIEAEAEHLTAEASDAIRELYSLL